MCQFIETMCVEQGRIINLDYHLARIMRTRKHFWNVQAPIPVNRLLAIAATQTERAKLRFEYDGYNIYNLSCTPYTIKKVETLRLVINDDIEYTYKNTNRCVLNQLKAQADGADEISIVKHNHITDTADTNIALFDGTQWVTPSTPLLNGTRRAQLIDAGRLIEQEVCITNLSSFQSISLINAMMDLNELVLPISSIVG